MAFTLEDAERMYTKAMDDANKGDSSAQLFVKHCDPYEWLSEGERAKAVAKADDDGKTDDAFRDAFHNDPDKNKFMFLTTVYPRVHPTEEIATALVLKWTKQYSDDSEMRPVITKANESLNKKDYIGALDVIHNALPVDTGALRDGIDYAEMHREEKALLKVKQRGRKKQRKKNRRLRENRDKELREKKRLLRKKVAEKNEKKKQSKRERKRFSPISKEIRMLDESIKDGFALK